MKTTTEIQPAQSQALLKALHILTRDGKLNQDSRRKLKQVNHLVNFIAPFVKQLIESHQDFSIVDHGAGKSYLGFMLYDALLKQGSAGRVIGVETRADLVDKARELAQDCGFTRMQFEALSVAEATASAQIPAQVQMVTALHACDTATDDAIAFALQKRAQHIVLVPCCQAEIARELRSLKAESLAQTPLAELWRHPIHTREFGSHLTNILRCLQLEAHGYQVTVTELVGWEHAMKNELIMAKFLGQPKKSAAIRRDTILREFKLESLQARFA